MTKISDIIFRDEGLAKREADAGTCGRRGSREDLEKGFYTMRNMKMSDIKDLLSLLHYLSWAQAVLGEPLTAIVLKREIWFLILKQARTAVSCAVVWQQ